VQLLTQQLEHVEGQFFVLQSRSLRERLLALLRVLLQTYGLDEQQRLRCRLPLSELATLLRSSVPAVRRALSALQRAQLLRLQGDYLVVANPQALERLLE
jgi:DNA-binding GntR family transcriptional regulator